MRSVLGVATACVLLAACSGEPYDRYVGFWKLEDGKTPGVLEISKEDDKTYLFKENVLEERNAGKSYALERKDNGELAVNAGFGSLPLVLSEDGETLRLKNLTFRRLSVQEWETFKQEVAQNQEKCQALEEEYKRQRDQPANPADWLEHRSRLSAEFRERAEQIPYCRAFFY